MSFDPLLAVLGLSSQASPSTPTTFSPTAVRGPLALQPGALPSSPTSGTVIIDSSDGNKLKWWDGSTWRVVNSGSPFEFVYVEASSDAGQVVVANITDLQYEDETTDTHAAWSGTAFTVPVSGVYAVCACWAATTFTNNSIYVMVNANAVFYGSTSDAAASGHGFVACALRLTAGDTVKFRFSHSETRSTNVSYNKMSISRIGDI